MNGTGPFPVFSVIMPCYNSEDYVRDAVNSLLRQSWPHWELVAVNDGSRDATPAILEAFARSDPRIRVVSKENGGYVSAVNMGLEHITGDYFLMMGSDDALDPQLFSRLAASMESGAADCIAFRTELIQDGVNLGVEQITDYPGPAEGFDTDLAQFARTYPAQAEIFFTRDTSKCFRRSLLGQLRYFGRYGFDADGIFSMLLCHNARSFRVLTVTGYYWTLRSDSLSGRKSFFAQDCDRVEIWTRFYTLLLEEGVSLAPVEEQFVHYYLSLVRGVWAEAGTAQKPLIREAAATIRAVQKRYHLELDLSRKDRLLLAAPGLWKCLSRCLAD